MSVVVAVHRSGIFAQVVGVEQTVVVHHVVTGEVNHVALLRALPHPLAFGKRQAGSAQEQVDKERFQIHTVQRMVYSNNTKKGILL